MITVFTPTYNRAQYLARAYFSLCKQTCQDFEWLIVDDGSTDDTQIWCDHIDKCWYPGRFRARVAIQTHGGKHMAHNFAMDLARGEWLTILDDDDELMPCAIEQMTYYTSKLPADYVGAVGLCVTNGEVHPTEKIGVMRTAEVKRHRFPALRGFVPEGIVWYRMVGKWKHTDEIWRVYHQDAPHRLSDVRPSLRARLHWYWIRLTLIGQYA